MTGSEEDSKVRVTEPSKVSPNIDQQQNTSNYHRHRDGPKVKHDPRSTTSSSQSAHSEGIGQRSSRSSSLEGGKSTSNRGNSLDSTPRVNNNSATTTEIDKSVTSSSVIIDEEYASLCLSDEELELVTKEEIVTFYHRLQDYIHNLKRKHQGELSQRKETEDILRQERAESLRREKVLIMRLTTRERQLVETEKEMAVLKKSIVPNLGALRSTLLDPAVNLIIQKLRNELGEMKKKLEDTQNDLSAWKFTPDSNTGKRLMAKCRMLYLENEDLGKQTSSGRVAQLENDLALNKQLVTEMKQSQTEMDDVVQELDEDIEGLQSAIQHLQKELRAATEKNATMSQPLTADPGETAELVTPSLSVLCAQCRRTCSEKQNDSSPVSKNPSSDSEETPLTLRIRPFSEIADALIDRTAGDDDSVKTGVMKHDDERTSLLNGELVGDDEKYEKVAGNYLSVQKMVSSVISASGNVVVGEEIFKMKAEVSSPDENDREVENGPSSAKRTKFNHMDDEVEYELKSKGNEEACHSSSTFNGNGSLGHHNH